MKRIRLIGLTLVVTAVSITGVTAYMQQGTQSPPLGLPDNPTLSPVELVYAQPFQLDEGYTHMWSADQPNVTAGYLMVVAVDNELLVPRQIHMPYLFVGDQIAERVNTGYESGYVLHIVPSDAGADGEPTLDLSEAPMFFSLPLDPTKEGGIQDQGILPEQMTQARIAQEVRGAMSQGVTPPSAQEVAAALEAPIYFATGHDLWLFAADLIEQYSPHEEDLVAGLRAPLVGK